jgi:hypothetical protein
MSVPTETNIVSISEVSPEQFARLFHRYHIALGPELAEEHDRTPAPCRWQELPDIERERMIAAARLTLLELEVFPAKNDSSEKDRRWFAKPGEAEWGC